MPQSPTVQVSIANVEALSEYPSSSLVPAAAVPTCVVGREGKRMNEETCAEGADKRKSRGTLSQTSKGLQGHSHSYSLLKQDLGNYKKIHHHSARGDRTPLIGVGSLTVPRWLM